MLEGSSEDSARELLGKLKSEVSHETYTFALKRGESLNLEDVVADLLGPIHRL